MPTSPDADIAVAFLGGFPGETAAGFHALRICRGLQLSGWRPLMLTVGYGSQSPPAWTEGADATWAIPYRAAVVTAWRAPLAHLLLNYRAGKRLEAMFGGLAGGGRIRACIFLGSSWFAFRGLLAVCERYGILAVSYPTEYPMLRNWTWLVVGGYFDTMAHIYALLPHVDGIIGISAFWAGFASNWDKPFTVIPSYAPSDTPHSGAPSRARGRHSGEEFHIVTVGHWTPRELPMVLLRAIRDLAEAGLNIRYTAVGRVGAFLSERSAVRFCMKAAALQGIVRITGWVDEGQKAEILSRADAFVLLRKDDVETAASFPTRLPEYLDVGRPVILSSAGDPPLYLRHGVSALVLPSDGLRSGLRNAIIHLSQNPELAAQIGRAGAVQGEESFSIRGNGRKMSQFLLSLRARGSSQRGRPRRAESELVRRGSW